MIILFAIVLIIGGYGLYRMKYRQDLLIEIVTEYQSQMKEMHLKANTLQRNIDELNKRVSSLALSLKTGNSDQSDHLLEELLATHHDLSVMIQVLLVHDLLENRDDRTQWWFSQLATIHAEQKHNILKKISERLSWKGFTELVKSKIKQHDYPEQFGAWGDLAMKMGIRIEKDESSQIQLLRKMSDALDRSEYQYVCQFEFNMELDHEVGNYLTPLCHPEDFVQNQWNASEL